MNQEIITTDGEVIDGFGVSSSMAVQLQKAEINQLITTARAYPRSMKRVQSAIMNMATLDEESAEECMYALPRGGKPIKGPSIRFAEILKQSFGNCRAGARVVDVDRVEMFVEAEGVFHDLETNASTTARVRRRISDKNGKLFKDDMIIVTGNAACSIAMRNAILAGVPKPLWRKAYDSVQATITGDVTTLSENREKALKALAAFGVKPEQIFASLGKEGLEDITVDDIGLLRGMYSALKNGEATVEEMFFGTVRTASQHEKIVDPLSDEPVKKEIKPAESVEFETTDGEITNTNPGADSFEAAGSDDASPSVQASSTEPEDSAKSSADPGSNEESAVSTSPNTPMLAAGSSSPIPEKEIIVLRRFAKDVLNMAAKPETSGELMSKVIRRWSNMELVGLSPEGKEAAKSIHSSVKAIMENSTSVESAIEYYSEVLGCDPTELMVNGNG
jgi:hypothetical protein